MIAAVVELEDEKFKLEQQPYESDSMFYARIKDLEAQYKLRNMVPKVDFLEVI